jgi:hypothetical protein
MYGGYDYWFGTFKYILDLSKPHTTNLYTYNYLDTKFGKYEIGFGTGKTNKHELKLKNKQSEITVILPYSIKSFVPQQDFSVICKTKKRAEILYDFSVHADSSWYCDSVTNLQMNKVTVLNMKVKNKKVLSK